MDSPFSFIDAVVIIFTFLSTILAMARGITREVLSVASFVGASLLSIYLGNAFAPVINSFINFQPIADKLSSDVDVISGWFAGATLFIILWIVFTVITARIARTINNSSVSGIDSALGLVFGILRGLFIVGIVYTLYINFIPPNGRHEAITHAKLKPILDETSSIIVGISSLILPEKVSNGFSKNTEDTYSTSPDSYSTSPQENAIQPQNPTDIRTPEDVLNNTQSN